MLRSILRLPLGGALPRFYSTTSSSTTTPVNPPPSETKETPASNPAPDKAKSTKMMSDDALREAMEEHSGGGLHAAELEGGKQVGLKRGVKSNMFRYI